MKPYLVFAACCLIWGSTFLAIRIGNESVPPIWAAALRLVLAAPLLFALVLITRQPLPRGPALRGALIFGVLNMGANFSLLYWGERVVPSGIAAVLYATVPLSTALMAAAMGVERLAPRKLAAAALAIVGVGIIFAGEIRLDVPVAGLVAVFLAATVAALSTVILKQYPQPSAIAVNAVGAVAGAVVCLLVSIALGGGPQPADERRGLVADPLPRPRGIARRLRSLRVARRALARHEREHDRRRRSRDRGDPGRRRLGRAALSRVLPRRGRRPRRGGDRAPSLTRHPSVSGSRGR